MASQSHRTCVADSSSSRHLSQVGSSVSPNFKGCLFRWQCPVNSPNIHLNWSVQFQQIICSSGREFWYKCLCLFESNCRLPLLYVISVCPIHDRSLGNSDWDVTGWFESCERMFRSSFVTNLRLIFYKKKTFYNEKEIHSECQHLFVVNTSKECIGVHFCTVPETWATSNWFVGQKHSFGYGIWLE
jgi:hypothetical protein